MSQQYDIQKLAVVDAPALLRKFSFEASDLIPDFKSDQFQRLLRSDLLGFVGQCLLCGPTECSTRATLKEESFTAVQRPASHAQLQTYHEAYISVPLAGREILASLVYTRPRSFILVVD